MPNGVTYSCMFTSNVGDIHQRYTASKVVPDFTQNPPTLTFHCLSSANANGETIPANIKLFYDNTEVKFNAGSKISTDGMFEIGGGDTTPWTVTIKKNYAKAGTAAQADHILRLVGELNEGGKVEGSVVLHVSELSETGKSVTITGEGNNPFVVDQNKGDSTKLKATIYEGGEPITNTAGYSFKWFQMSASGWSALSGKTADTLEVTADMVDSYAEFMVEVTKGTEKYSDTQSVMDVGDPYFVGIVIKANSASGAETDGSFGSSPADTDKKVLTAVLQSHNGSAKIPTIKTCYWQIMKADGVILNSSYTGGSYDNKGEVWDAKQNKTSITIPYSFLKAMATTSIEVVAVVTY